MTKIRRLYTFHGRVQGVGFRYRASYAAQALGLTGWVRNEYDGTVSMEVQGGKEAIERLIMQLQNDRYISIDWFEQKDRPVDEEERRFRVRGY